MGLSYQGGDSRDCEAMIGVPHVGYVGMILRHSYATATVGVVPAVFGLSQALNPRSFCGG